MLSEREREYLSNKEEFGTKYGLEYVRSIRSRIKKKAEQAISDLILIAEGDEMWEEIEKKTKRWAIYRTLRGEGSGVFDPKALAEHYLNPPKRGNVGRWLIQPQDIERLVHTAAITYPIRGDVLSTLIEKANARMRYWQMLRKTK